MSNPSTSVALHNTHRVANIPGRSLDSLTVVRLFLHHPHSLPHLGTIPALLKLTIYVCTLYHHQLARLDILDFLTFCLILVYTSSIHSMASTSVSLFCRSRKVYLSVMRCRYLSISIGTVQVGRLSKIQILWESPTIKNDSRQAFNQA